MVTKLNLNSYNLYYNDIFSLLSELKNDEEALRALMDDIEYYLINKQAIIGGHVINDRLLSFIWGHKRFYSNENRLHISYVVVDKNHRGRGFSKDLLQFISDEAKKSGIFKIDLNVAPDNDVSISAYKNFGFITERYLMSKNLDRE